MGQLVDAIKAWPVIVQGALGSAVFWVALVAGQWAFGRISSTYSHYSKEARRSWLTDRRATVLAQLSKSDVEFATYATIMLYRASRPLFKALMWLAMGLVFETFFGPAGIVGFIGCIFYLLKALAIVGKAPKVMNPSTEIAAIDAEIAKLRAPATALQVPPI